MHLLQFLHRISQFLPHTFFNLQERLYSHLLKELLKVEGFIVVKLRLISLEIVDGSLFKILAISLKVEP